jgi:flagellar motility protein MotE (MotC chaperone)
MRLLLITILAAALMLTVRIADLWDGIVDSFGAAPAVAADAQPQADAAPPADKAAAPQQPTAPDKAAAAQQPAAPDMAAPQQPAAQDMAKPEAPMDAGASAAAAPASAAEDEMSDAELATLQDLAARRDQLDAREKELDTRAGMLAAGQKRVDEKIAELKQLQATLQGLLKTYDEQETGKLKSLVKIYENMKPKDAAPIFEKLDMDTLLDIVERMKEAKVAPVLAKMNPAKAKEVTDELARRHQISQAVGADGT